MSDDVLDFLLSGVRDQLQRNEITSAYYAFASGDHETFAVRFAVLLKAHALSLKSFPARFQKAIATETNRLTDVILAHQASVRTSKEAMNADGAGDSLEALKTIQCEIEQHLVAHSEFLKQERERLGSAVIANERAFKRLATDRIVLALVLSYMAGILSVLALQHLLPFLT